MNILHPNPAPVQWNPDPDSWLDPILELVLDPFRDDDHPGLCAFEAPAPMVPTFATPAEWIRAQAGYYASLGTALGDLVAAELGRLATESEFHGASTAEELEARRELAERDRDTQIFDAGFDCGRHGGGTL